MAPDSPAKAGNTELFRAGVLKRNGRPGEDVVGSSPLKAPGLKAARVETSGLDLEAESESVAAALGGGLPVGEGGGLSSGSGGGQPGIGGNQFGAGGGLGALPAVVGVPGVNGFVPSPPGNPGDGVTVPVPFDMSKLFAEMQKVNVNVQSSLELQKANAIEIKSLQTQTSQTKDEIKSLRSDVQASLDQFRSEIGKLKEDMVTKFTFDAL